MIAMQVRNFEVSHEQVKPMSESPVLKTLVQLFDRGQTATKALTIIYDAVDEVLSQDTLWALGQLLAEFKEEGKFPDVCAGVFDSQGHLCRLLRFRAGIVLGFFAFLKAEGVKYVDEGV